MPTVLRIFYDRRHPNIMAIPSKAHSAVTVAAQSKNAQCARLCPENFVDSHPEGQNGWVHMVSNISSIKPKSG